MRKFAGIRYFRGFLCLYFTGIKIIQVGIETGVKNIKIGEILGKGYIDEISWYMGLSRIFNEVPSIFLLKFSSVLITRL